MAAAAVLLVAALTAGAGNGQQLLAQSDTAEVAVRIPERDLIPEGVAYDPVERAFFVSSTWRRKIVRVDSLGRAADFTAEAQDGLWGVVGMDVDAGRRTLWAASSHAGEFMPIRNAPAGEEGSSGLWAYDVDTGRLRARHVLDLADGPSFLNDVAVARDGTVYVSDSARNALYRLRPGGASLERFVDVPESPNGLDLSADERWLFVAQRGRIGRVDLTTREVLLLDTEPGVPMEGMDGLYVHEGDLVVVGGVGEGESRSWFVARYELSADHDRVVAGHNLLPRHPLLRQPTTGVIVGDAIYVVANGQLQHFRRLFEAGRDGDLDQLDEPVLLRVPLAPQPARAGGCQPGDVRLTYLANEGFLLDDGEVRVLVDALFRNGLDHYGTPEGAWKERLEGAAGEFADVAVVLVTHVHRDHFDPRAVAAHLRGNPRSVLAAPAAAADSLRAVDAGDLVPRLRVVAAPEGGRTRLTSGDVEITALGLPHHGTRNPVDNVGWLLRMAGRTLVHLGDAEVQRERYRKLGFRDTGVDVVLVPYWLLLDAESRSVIEDELRPREIVAMHLDVSEGSDAAESVAEVLPDAWAPTTTGERWCIAEP